MKLLLIAAAMTTCIASHAGDQQVQFPKDVADQIIGYCKGQQDRNGVHLEECVTEVAAEVVLFAVVRSTDQYQIAMDHLHQVNLKDRSGLPMDHESLVVLAAGAVCRLGDIKEPTPEKQIACLRAVVSDADRPVLEAYLTKHGAPAQGVNQ